MLRSRLRTKVLFKIVGVWGFESDLIRVTKEILISGKDKKKNTTFGYAIGYIIMGIMGMGITKILVLYNSGKFIVVVDFKKCTV